MTPKAYKRQILVDYLLRFAVIAEYSARTNKGLDDHVMGNRNRHTKEKVEDPK